MATQTVERDPVTGRPRARATQGTTVVPPRTAATPPPAAPGGAGGGSTPPAPANSRTDGSNPLSLAGGPGRGSVPAVAGMSANPGLVGGTDFWNSPGVMVGAQRGYDPGQQYSSMRVTGEQIESDPWVSASLKNFAANVQPELQNRANLMGLGRSTAALNAQSNAQMQALLPLYQQAAQLEEGRINRMMGQGQFEAGLSQQNLGRLGESTESELARRERSSERVSNANQNMIANLMGLSQGLYGRQQQTGQNLMGAGGTFRDIAQQGNAAAQQDFLRRQALGEQAVYAPFGGLAQGGLGSTTSSTGK